MIYLLDTTAFSALMRRDAKIRARVATLTPTDQGAICTITPFPFDLMSILMICLIHEISTNLKEGGP